MKAILLHTFKTVSPLWLMAILGAYPFWSQAQPRKFRLPIEVQEASGLYLQDSTHFWWINDSGDGPFIYQTDANEDLVQKVKIPNAFNKDWEDITHDAQGRIYIGDFGINYHARSYLPMRINVDFLLPTVGATSTWRLSFGTMIVCICSPNPISGINP